MINTKLLREIELRKCEKCGSASLIIIDKHKHVRDKHCLNTDCLYYVDESEQELER